MADNHSGDNFSETPPSQHTLHAQHLPNSPHDEYHVHENDAYDDGGWGNGGGHGGGNHNDWNNYNPWNIGGWNGPQNQHWNNHGHNGWGGQHFGGAPVQGVDSHFRPSIHQNPSPIVQPHHHGRQFEIRPQYLSILPTFRGVASDEPYTHLEEFDAICSTIGSQGFTPDEVKLILFRFSLKDRAKQWFLSLPSGSIHNWTQMQQIFLDEYLFDWKN